jgi:hypothetical protein
MSSTDGIIIGGLRLKVAQCDLVLSGVFLIIEGKAEVIRVGSAMDETVCELPGAPAHDNV